MERERKVNNASAFDEVELKLPYRSQLSPGKLDEFESQSCIEAIPYNDQPILCKYKIFAADQPR